MNKPNAMTRRALMAGLWGASFYAFGRDAYRVWGHDEQLFQPYHIDARSTLANSFLHLTFESQRNDVFSPVFCMLHSGFEGPSGPIEFPLSFTEQPTIAVTARPKSPNLLGSVTEINDQQYQGVIFFKPPVGVSPLLPTMFLLNRRLILREPGEYEITFRVTGNCEQMSLRSIHMGSKGIRNELSVCGSFPCVLKATTTLTLDPIDHMDLMKIVDEYAADAHLRMLQLFPIDGPGVIETSNDTIPIESFLCLPDSETVSILRPVFQPLRTRIDKEWNKPMITSPSGTGIAYARALCCEHAAPTEAKCNLLGWLLESPLQGGSALAQEAMNHATTRLREFKAGTTLG